MKEVSVYDLKTHLSSLLREVESGEEIVITRSRIPVAKITRLVPDGVRRKLGSARGAVIMSDDFEDELGEFDDYRWGDSNLVG